MDVMIRPIAPDDKEALLRLTLATFAPIFRSFNDILGVDIYDVIFPDWQAEQTKHVTAAYNEDVESWVAEWDGTAVGFVICKLDDETKIGEVYFLAVDPAHQNRGIGTALNQFTLDKMREAGMHVAHVGTGGDPSHAAARRVYENAGYTPLVNMLYYKNLRDEE